MDPDTRGGLGGGDGGDGTGGWDPELLRLEICEELLQELESTPEVVYTLLAQVRAWARHQQAAVPSAPPCSPVPPPPTLVPASSSGSAWPYRLFTQQSMIRVGGPQVESALVDWFRHQAPETLKGRLTGEEFKVRRPQARVAWRCTRSTRVPWRASLWPGRPGDVVLPSHALRCPQP